MVGILTPRMTPGTIAISAMAVATRVIRPQDRLVRQPQFEIHQHQTLSEARPASCAAIQCRHGNRGTILAIDVPPCKSLPIGGSLGVVNNDTQAPLTVSVNVARYHKCLIPTIPVDTKSAISRAVLTVRVYTLLKTNNVLNALGGSKMLGSGTTPTDDLDIARNPQRPIRSCPERRLRACKVQRRSTRSPCPNLQRRSAEAKRSRRTSRALEARPLRRRRLSRRSTLPFRRGTALMWTCDRNLLDPDQPPRQLCRPLSPQPSRLLLLRNHPADLSMRVSDLSISDGMSASFDHVLIHDIPLQTMTIAPRTR